MPRPHGPRVRPRVSLHDAGLTALVLTVAMLSVGHTTLDQQAVAGPEIYAWVALACLPVLAWRWRPVWAYAATSAAIATYFIAGNPFGAFLIASVITAYGLASRTNIRTALLAAGAVVIPAAVAFGITLLVNGTNGAPFEKTAVWAVLWVGIPTAVGMTVRARREARSRVRVEQARRAISEERLQIAQDVHDVVGHSLAVIAMQAGVALHVMRRSPDKAQESLEMIRSASKQALEDLRVELAQLRGEQPAPRQVSPGLNDVAVLVDRIRSSGLDVELDRDTSDAAVPAATALVVYRIVQEALTNVLRHAGPAATARVSLHRTDRILNVRVIDTGLGAPPEAGGTPDHGTGAEFTAEGSGIRGMRNRAEAIGGELVVGPRPGGGFAVHASLPLQSFAERRAG